MRVSYNLRPEEVPSNGDGSDGSDGNDGRRGYATLRVHSLTAVATD